MGIMQAAIFNTLRILKRQNPGDCYYEAYLGHLQKSGPEFYDQYMLLWEIAVTMAPRRILEIGTRTGISRCQLMSAYIDPSIIEKVTCIDPFMDPYTSAALVLRNLKYLNLPTDKIEFLVEKSQDCLPKLIARAEKYDYLLVDGSHEQKDCRNDLEAVHNLVAPGGVIVMDDASQSPGECGLIVVWDQFKAEHEMEYNWHQNLSGKGTAWAFKK